MHARPVTLHTNFMYAVFKVRSDWWLSVIRVHKVFYDLWSLVRPVLSVTALPGWFGLAPDLFKSLLSPLRSNGTPCPVPVSIWIFFLLIWRPPALPHRLQCSTIGRLGLNRRVRDGNGCVPQTHRHQKFRVTKVSARSIPEVRGKPAFLSAYGIDCICDAVATE